MTAPDLRVQSPALSHYIGCLRHAMLCPRSDVYEKIKPCICSRGEVEAELASHLAALDEARELARMVVAEWCLSEKEAVCNEGPPEPASVTAARAFLARTTTHNT